LAHARRGICHLLSNIPSGRKCMELLVWQNHEEWKEQLGQPGLGVQEERTQQSFLLEVLSKYPVATRRKR